MRLNCLFLTALSTKIFHRVHKDLNLCNFKLSAQWWRPEGKRLSGSRDIADQWFGKKKLVGVGIEPWSRLIFDFSHDHVVHFVNTTHQKTRNFVTHPMRQFLSRSGKWKLRYSSKTDFGFVAATWHMLVISVHKVDRTCNASLSTCLSRSGRDWCSTSWETSKALFGTFTSRRYQLWVPAAAHVLIMPQNAPCRCIVECILYMFAKGQVSKHHSGRKLSKALFGTWAKTQISALIACYETIYTMNWAGAPHDSLVIYRPVFWLSNAEETFEFGLVGAKKHQRPSSEHFEKIPKSLFFANISATVRPIKASLVPKCRSQN